jgi:two-component system chemotaxis response regulator CheY
MPAQTILIVDDDPICIAVASLALRQAGFTIQAAADGVAALERLETLQPDLILSDIQMPNMDGFELARRARSMPRFREIPMIALTAFAGPATEQQAYDAGFTGYMAKPISASSLALRIRGFLERPLRPLRLTSAPRCAM